MSSITRCNWRFGAVLVLESHNTRLFLSDYRTRFCSDKLHPFGGAIWTIIAAGDNSSKADERAAVSAGRIGGEGQKVIWDLSDVADGTYTANVEVNDSTGHTAHASTTVTIALCRSCITRESACPTVMVSCPENAKSNQSMTFQAHVYGGDPTVNVTYTWSVTAGKISGGQGTPMITIDVSDVAGGSVTAMVLICGHEPACVNTASCTTRTVGGVAKAGCQPRSIAVTMHCNPVLARTKYEAEQAGINQA